MGRLVIGTRGSALALWQARHVAARLRELHPDLTIEEKVIASEGDLDARASIASLGTTGIFVRRLEQALLAHEIDVAVHSLKDLPSDQPTGLGVAAIPERHDARDALVTRDGRGLDDLDRGATVGTGSYRRRAQLLHLRPDLQITPIRGNVDTRVGKVRSGELGAVVLAVAGLERLGIADVGIRPLDPTVCVPAVGQGALAVEVRVDDRSARALVEPLMHEPSVAAIGAERAFFRKLGGGCQAPAAAWARFDGGRFVVDAVVGDPDGQALIREREAGDPARAYDIGVRLAERLLVAGARRMLRAVREKLPQDHA